MSRVLGKHKGDRQRVQPWIGVGTARVYLAPGALPGQLTFDHVEAPEAEKLRSSRKKAPRAFSAGSFNRKRR